MPEQLFLNQRENDTILKSPIDLVLCYNTSYNILSMFSYKLTVNTLLYLSLFSYMLNVAYLRQSTLLKVNLIKEFENVLQTDLQQDFGCKQGFKYSPKKLSVGIQMHCLHQNVKMLTEGWNDRQAENSVAPKTIFCRGYKE